MKSNTIVFIHGMYMTPLCWEHWMAFFQAKGYTCLAPAWPGRDKTVEILRKPGLELGNLSLKAVVDEVANSVKTLKEKPVLIGHSMGALVVQILLQQDIAAAGVAIDSAPPLGVLTTRWEFLKSNWPHINPFVPQGQPVIMSFERFQYCFVNSLPLEEQRAAYDRYVVPESRRVPAGSLTSLAAIDFKKQHAPLLMIAGSNDHLIPASLNKTNFNKYKNPASIVDFKEFAGRTHFIIGQSGWEEVAGYVAGWLSDRSI
ncbi:MAG: alpha/beta fold hydrolase [Dehalococcoidia bacterium]